MVDWQDFSPDSVKQIREALGPPREARTTVCTDPIRPSTHNIQQIGLWDSFLTLGYGSEMSALLQVESGEIWLAQREGGGYSNDRFQRYHGKIYPSEAAGLCEFLVQLDFFALADEYVSGFRFTDVYGYSAMMVRQTDRLKFVYVSGASHAVFLAGKLFFRHLMRDAQWVEQNREMPVPVAWEQIVERQFADG